MEKKVESKDKTNKQKKKQVTKKTSKTIKKDSPSLKPKKKIYISYYKRLSCYIFLCILFLFFALYFISSSVNISKEENIKYYEKGTIDYKVCLKDNDFYEEECLNKNMSYVANLIKNMPLSFNYDFSTTKKINLTPKYEIIADLTISNSDESTDYYEKKYILKSLSKVEKDNANYTIKDNSITIDYDYYNTIASKFKSQYNVETKSNLKISYIVYNDSADIHLSPSITSINIPLSEKSLNINMKSVDINNNDSQDLVKYKFELSNMIYLLLGIISVIISIYSVIKAVRMVNVSKEKKNKFDKYTAKILKEYDRLIVETTSLPHLDDYNIIKINKFEELLDVRDNMKLPIMYYEVAKHQKAHLYILHENNLYLLTIKDIDME